MRLHCTITLAASLLLAPALAIAQKPDTVVFQHADTAVVMPRVDTVRFTQTIVTQDTAAIAGYQKQLQEQFYKQLALQATYDSLSKQYAKILAAAPQVIIHVDTLTTKNPCDSLLIVGQKFGASWPVVQRGDSVYYRTAPALTVGDSMQMSMVCVKKPPLILLPLAPDAPLPAPLPTTEQPVALPNDPNP